MKQNRFLPLIFLIFCLLAFSNITSADIQKNYQNIPLNSNIAFQGTEKVLDNAYDKELETWKKNLNNAEKKLPSIIAYLLISNDKRPKGFELSTIKTQLSENNQIKYSTHMSATDQSTIASTDLLYVYISVYPGITTSILDPLVNEIVSRDEENHIIAAWVELSKLSDISNLSNVQLVSLVYPPIVNTGSVNSEGDSILKASNVRSLAGGSTGAGIKVGVISDGVDSLASSIASGDLPSSLQVLSNLQGGDEGTAMCEVVHDLAPGATIAFSDAASNVISFAQHMQDLANVGCHVIVDDIAYANEPFFEDGIIAQKANSLYSNNRLIVSSAGNAARCHAYGTYTPQGSTSWHDFSSAGSSSIDPTPNNPNLYVNVPTGANVRAILQWNDKWGASGNDYDLYIKRASDGVTLASSIGSQTGTQNPFEFCSWTNTGTSTDVYIQIKKYSGSTKTLEVYIWTAGSTTYTNNIVSSYSTYGHATATGTIGVGAISVLDPGQNDIEIFSSLGPRSISYPSSSTRQKPDITGVDGNLITGAGNFGSKDGSYWRFYGTSSAAPHIAALGALLWSKNPSGKSATDIRNALTNKAVDLGASGYDYIYGYGRADALASYNYLYPSSTITSSIGVVRGKTWSMDYNGNGYWNSGDKTANFGVGDGKDKPVTGDWNGNGKINIGVVRGNKWYVDFNGNGYWDSGDKSATFGVGDGQDKPVTGDWNGNGKINIGVVRGNKWYVDFNGNGYWDAGDKSATFGVGDGKDMPVVGKWSGTGVASIESVEANQVQEPESPIQPPTVTRPESDIPRVEMPVKSSPVISPMSGGGVVLPQNPLVNGGGVPGFRKPVL